MQPIMGGVTAFGVGMLCVGSSGLTKGLVSRSGSAKIPPDVWGIPPSLPPSCSQQNEMVLGAPTMSRSQKKRLPRQAWLFLEMAAGCAAGRGVSWLCDLEQGQIPLSFRSSLL